MKDIPDLQEGIEKFANQMKEIGIASVQMRINHIIKTNTDPVDAIEEIITYMEEE